MDVPIYLGCGRYAKTLLLDNQAGTKRYLVGVLLTAERTGSIGNLDRISSIFGGRRLVVCFVGADPSVGGTRVDTTQ